MTLFKIDAKMIINLSLQAINIGIKALSKTRMIISFRLSITLKQLQQPIQLLLHLLTLLEVISGKSPLLHFLIFDYFHALFKFIGYDRIYKFREIIS